MPQDHTYFSLVEGICLHVSELECFPFLKINCFFFSFLFDSDAFARLYDRRMLPPLTSSRKRMPPPPCVNYFCPMHLSERVSLIWLIYILPVLHCCGDVVFLFKVFFSKLTVRFIFEIFQGRTNLHLTHVTFSPNGEEVLLSYSGEHVYLMNVNNGIAVEMLDCFFKLKFCEYLLILSFVC